MCLENTETTPMQPLDDFDYTGWLSLYFHSKWGENGLQHKAAFKKNGGNLGVNYAKLFNSGYIYCVNVLGKKMGLYDF